MKLYKHTLINMMLALGLVACGGGDGDSAVSGDTPGSVAGGTEQTTTMKDIKVAPDFDFTTSQRLEVNVDLRDITDQRAYIGFYQQWSGKGQSSTPDPDSQLLLFVTDDGLLNQSLVIGKQQQSLLMVVMFTDTSLFPITEVFEVDGNGYQYP
ncbi:hypothetical protein C9I98_15685 [Photobacterium sanctipauli]|uniref:Uncharacterized protein n=1 Tax=Photobacterium sanctipauli TaxID=1342794 RepID=A0A2T3NQL8_9GAMM|nr:hypothetical protein [Photobacterium sanctipauli]PSW18522.1 hypothetical protein C9I98_15685 [Photobacterium sanctipauli]